MSEISAYHEAGHAFLALYVGARVQSITIDPDWDDGPERHGDTQVAWKRSRFSEREFHEKSILVSLAGPVAEMIHTGDPYHPGMVAEWSHDWAAAWESAGTFLPDERQRLAYLEEASLKLYRLLHRDEHWAALAAIVDNLLAHETLEGDEVREIYRDWMG